MTLNAFKKFLPTTCIHRGISMTDFKGDKNSVCTTSKTKSPTGTKIDQGANSNLICNYA